MLQHKKKRRASICSDAPGAAVVQHPEFYVVNAGLFIKMKTHEDHLCGVPGKKHSCSLYGSFSSEGWDNVCTLGCSWWCRIASYSLATMQLGTIIIRQNDSLDCFPYQYSCTTMFNS